MGMACKLFGGQTQKFYFCHLKIKYNNFNDSSVISKNEY